MQRWRDYEKTFARTIANSSGRLVGKVASRDRARKPVAWLLDEFMLGLSDELESRGISRRVAAGMFGVSRRTYIRQLHAAQAGRGGNAGTLWWEVLGALRRTPMRREEVLEKFANQTPESLGSVLFDMLENDLVQKADDHTLHVVAMADEWTDERLTNFLLMKKGVGELPALEEIAMTLGVSLRRLQQLPDQSGAHFTVVNPEHESLYNLLGLVLSHAFGVVSRELDGEPTEAFLFRIEVADRKRADMAQIQRLFLDAKDGLWDAVGRLIEESESTREPGDNVVTMVMSQLVDRVTEPSDEGV